MMNGNRYDMILAFTRSRSCLIVNYRNYTPCHQTRTHKQPIGNFRRNQTHFVLLKENKMDLFPNMGGGGAAAAAADSATADDGKDVDLRDKIETKECYARNEAAGFPMSNLFIGDSRLGCKSDADEQLILHIAFNEFVKLRTIELIEFNNGMDPESNPSKVHLYVNRENLGFEDCEDVDPTQTLHLTAEDMKKPIPLKYVKFQRVKIEDNQGGDVTALGGIRLMGRVVGTTNMAEFKKQSQG